MIIGVDANEANVANRVGSNHYAFQILRHLHRLDKKNHYRIYLQKPPLEDLPASSQRWSYRVIKPRFLWTQWRLPIDLCFSRSRPDLFFSLGHYAPRFSPIPTIVCLMDLAYLKFPQFFLKKDLCQLKNWTKYSVKKASNVITISQHSKKDIEDYYRIPSQKITVAYPGVGSDPVQDIPQHQIEVIKKKYQINENYLLYLGTLQPRKNIINLVKAYHQLVNRYPNLLLVIAGKKGWLYQDLFKLVKKLNLEDKVIFTGFVVNRDVSALIKGARLFVLPSLYEGFGIPVVQAMTIGTPVLVSRNSSLEEIVSDCGLYIEAPFQENQVRQGIIEALSLKNDNQQHLVSQAKKRAAQFQWGKSALKILEVINGITI